MSKLEELLTQAAAGKRPGEPMAHVDRAAVVAELVAIVSEAARTAASLATANVPKPTVVVQPAPRTAWRLKVIRREGLIEEIIATPEAPQ